MPKWVIYREDADGDQPAEPIGSIEAASQSEAIEKGSQFYELPQHDVIAKQEEPTNASK